MEKEILQISLFQYIFTPFIALKNDFFRKTKIRRTDELSERVCSGNPLTRHLTPLLQQKGPEKEGLVRIWKQEDQMILYCYKLCVHK